MMSTMQGAMTPLTSSPTSSVVPRPKGHGVPPTIGTEFVASGAHVSARKSLLYGKGVTDSGFRRLSQSSKTSWRQKRAGMCNVKASILQDISTTAKKDTVVLNGSLLVSNVTGLGAAAADTAKDLLKLEITLQLVSVELDPRTKGPKLSEKSNLTKVPLTDPKASLLSGDQQYKVTFNVPKDFGEVGAFQIWNSNSDKFYLHYMTLVISDKTSVQFPGKSWVFNQSYYSAPRVFFSNKTCLPSATPAGLQALRQSELIILRGNGTGERVDHDRIYDYDIYNDLSNPDVSKRIPLGGSKDFPYPRRIRTGAHSANLELTMVTEFKKINADMYPYPRSEIRTDLPFFIPPDEKFNREFNYSSRSLADGLQSIPYDIALLSDVAFDTDTWNNFDETKALFEGGLPLPQLLQVDSKAWMTDEEFGRQTLAGVNPSLITLLTEFPPKSSLDPKVYGQGTALTESDIEPYLEGKTVTEAVAGKRLFTVDYHDVFLPYINKINALSNKGYAPRSIYYYTDDRKMIPVAIELSLPPSSAGGKAVNRVLTPPRTLESDDHTWMLGKLHASTTDCIYHEIYSHLTQAHAVMEPVIIASNRQLSRLHPLFTYLLPLFRNTMVINSSARQTLINGDGIIESTSTPGKYSLEMSTQVYKAVWRFDHEAFPEALITRGMAERDGDGVKLVIDDYPYATDGLEIWDAVKTYTAKYVNIVYKGADKAVQSDTELQNWWNEIIKVGHGDKKDEPWWPKLNSVATLVEVLTTISWIAGPHHAAHNFGQYAYNSFFPNRPLQTRKLIPEKGTAEYRELQANPEKYWLSSISSRPNSEQLAQVFALLSTHAVDEVFIGERPENRWTSDPQVEAAFTEFSASIRDLGQRQDTRNKDSNLPNRNGPVKLPYTLLYPSSPAGLTGKGVPNSTSI